MSLRLNGSTSGYTEINAPAVAGSNTLVLPTGNGTADQALVTNGSGTLSFADRGRMTLGTVQNTTSGTSIDFTGIPSWVKRVTVMFDGVSTNGTSQKLVQLGSGSFATTGYTSFGAQFNPNAGTSGSTSSTAGFIFQSVLGADALIGLVPIILVTGNTWATSYTVMNTTTLLGHGAGNVTLSGTLDRIRITTVNGTDTFDAGSVNILIEG